MLQTADLEENDPAIPSQVKFSDLSGSDVANSLVTLHFQCYNTSGPLLQPLFGSPCVPQPEGHACASSDTDALGDIVEMGL